MIGILMAFGPLRFSLTTAAYDQLTRTSRYDWKRIDRVGAMPALQFTGPQNDGITISGSLIPGFTGGAEHIEKMRAIAGTGLPMPLISGTGRVLGLWVIESVEETGTRHFKDGYPRVITFSLTLTKYSDGPGVFGLITKATQLLSLFG
jgi:phage protein U